MKIAVVHNLAVGGAHRRLRSQIRALTDHDVLEVTLSTAAPVTDSAVVLPVRQWAEAKSRLLRPPLRYMDLLARMRAWSEVAAVVNAWEPDICFLNPCQYLKTPPLVNKVHAAVVYYCDEPRRAYFDPSAADSFNSSTKGLYYPMRRIERFSERRNTAAADRVATNSRYTAGLIQDAMGVESQLVRCGVATSFTGESGRVPKHLLSVGTLIPSKGHDLAIEAAGLSQVALPLVIVSPRVGPAAEQLRLKQLAVACGVELRLVAGIPETELRDLYRTAYATLYLAKAEPFGLVSIEAQACGSPMIVADEGGLPETIDDGRTGWSVPRDAKAAALALDGLRDDAVRSAMVRAAPGWAAGFTWEKSAASLEAVFADVA